jgi:hypothetical protein
MNGIFSPEIIYLGRLSPESIYLLRLQMLLQEFSERAAECIRMAARATSDHDRDIFIELARAWCGLTKEAPGTDTRPRH